MSRFYFCLSADENALIYKGVFFLSFSHFLLSRPSILSSKLHVYCFFPSCFFGSAFLFFFAVADHRSSKPTIYVYTTPLSVATLASQSSCKREPHLNVGGGVVAAATVGGRRERGIYIKSR